MRSVDKSMSRKFIPRRSWRVHTGTSGDSLQDTESNERCTQISKASCRDTKTFLNRDSLTIKYYESATANSNYTTELEPSVADAVDKTAEGERATSNSKGFIVGRVYKKTFMILPKNVHFK